MEFSLINDNYKLTDNQLVYRFLEKYPNIYKFLIDNIVNFKTIVNFPISLEVTMEKPCNCTDEEEDLIWLYVESNNSLSPKKADEIETHIFDTIISPEWYNLNGMVGVSIR